MRLCENAYAFFPNRRCDQPKRDMRLESNVFNQIVRQHANIYSILIVF